MWRQGDILIETIEALPKDVRPLNHLVLASGDSTGHRHMIKKRKLATLYAMPFGRDENFYLDVTADEADVVHPEHETITLQKGLYRVWRQREFGENKRPVRVVD